MICLMDSERSLQEQYTLYCAEKRIQTGINVGMAVPKTTETI